MTYTQPQDQDLIARARHEARAFQHKYIRTEHLFLAVLHQMSSNHQHVLSEHGLTYDCFQAEVATLSCPVCAANETMILTPSAQRSLIRAQQHCQCARPDNTLLLSSIIETSPLVRRLLQQCSVDTDHLQQVLMQTTRMDSSHD